MWWDERMVSFSRARHKASVVLQIDCAFTRELIQTCFQLRPEWTVQEVDPQSPSPVINGVYWSEYELIDWSRVLRGEVISSCYCIRKGLIRKAQLSYNLKKWTLKRPGNKIGAHLPETYIFDVSDPEYFEEALYDVPEVKDMKEGVDVWIAKPSIVNQGKEIVVFDRLTELEEMIKRAPELREWVVQRYIHPPLLLKNRKFHLRCYVLCVGNVEVFLWRDILVLLASQEYDINLKDLSKKDSHLTNTCLQDESEDLVWLLSEIPEMLRRENGEDQSVQMKISNIIEDICKILGESFEALACELSFLPLPNCFEHFGFDFLVDDQWKVWLLEANAEPDFKQTGDRLKPRLQEMFEHNFQLIFDPLPTDLSSPKDFTLRTTPTSEGYPWRRVFSRQM